ncbi:uncharacterized protein J8A68_003969 [[Candida] subhashii]|uniref:ENTH domain-containing protein n=1 Tax=[Candida] subhashii TaxID=561895 RepID=A0A8J5QL74_9ASCO|nr:uncharacterized protein J8A68_003969 [[Candida] subhashii]KAG7662505.1 hypothetical protein J8A68_003969 [[Candida] subhashii]
MTNNIIQSIKNITSSTESKIKNAINTEPLGPYNHELIELATLTINKKHLSVITSILTKKLSPLIKEASKRVSSEDVTSLESEGVQPVTRVRRAKSIAAFVSNRINSNKQQQPPMPKRSQSIPNLPQPHSSSSKKHSRKPEFDSKTYLSLLKTLTVILYLLQNGSEEFVNWVEDNYQTLLKPLRKLTYPKKYNETIRYKLSKITSLMENSENLHSYRVNIHKLRTDMLSPGIKRTSLDGIDLLHHETSPIDYTPTSRRFSGDYTLSSNIIPTTSITSNNHDDSISRRLSSHFSAPPSPPRGPSSISFSPPRSHSATRFPPTSPKTPNAHQLSPIF